jgi:membrane fusion protein (multidrug efflux system)
MSLRFLTPAMLALLLAACGGDGEGQKGGGGRGGPPATVTTEVVASGPWSDSIEALGTASARESLAITAKVSETVGQVHFDSGDSVRAGEVLVTLSNGAQLAGLNEANADFKEAQQLLDRQQALAQRQLVAASQLDLQRASRDAAKARLEQIRAQLSDRVIAAPFAGVLGLRQVSPGSLVTPGTVITTLDDISRIKLDFSVPERYLPTLAVDREITARSDTWPGEEFRGRITSVGSRVDPVTRAIAARAEFDNPEGRLRAGMLMAVRIYLPAREAVSIPEIAVVQVARDAFVYLAKADGTVEQLKVQLGERRDGRVEIVQGLKVGDRIVIDGTVKLRPGSKIVEAGSEKPAAGK